MPAESDKNTPVNMEQRQAKEQRLRELMGSEKWVKTIVEHMEKHYRNVKPPPWLDLNVVAGQLCRSTSDKRSSHSAVRSMREDLAQILDWKKGHSNWKEAVQREKMPHLGTRSEITALEFLNPNGALPSLPGMLIDRMVETDLRFLLAHEPGDDSEVPEFWKGAQLNDPAWRNQYMVKRNAARRLTFEDDLNDLVLSTVCQSDMARVSSEQHSSPAREEATDKEEEDMSDSPDDEDDEPKHKKRKVEAGVGTSGAERSNKRQKRTEGGVDSETPIDTIEDGGDNGASELDNAFRRLDQVEKQCKQLKSSRGRLKRKDAKLEQQLAELSSELDKKLQSHMEQTAAQYKELYNENSTRKQQHQQLVDECGRLQAWRDSLEKEHQKLAARLTELADRFKELPAARSDSQTGVKPEEDVPLLSQQHQSTGISMSTHGMARFQSQGAGLSAATSTHSGLPTLASGTARVDSDEGRPERPPSRRPRIPEMPTFDPTVHHYTELRQPVPHAGYTTYPSSLPPYTAAMQHHITPSPTPLFTASLGSFPPMSSFAPHHHHHHHGLPSQPLAAGNNNNNSSNNHRHHHQPAHTIRSNNHDNMDDHHQNVIIQTALAGLPSHSRDALLPFLTSLDRVAWTAHPDDIARECEINGLVWVQLRELVQGIQWAMRQHGVIE
ncbi:hypothetical protein VTK56DRAFT_5178 [Thermocarpiscus australiensis]